MKRLALTALCIVACGGTPAPCAPETELGVIEARFQAELVEKCAAFMPADPPTECPAYLELRERARRARERWAACQR